MSTPQKIFLLDGYHFLFRAYFVNPSLTSPKGAPTGAIYGFTTMLIRILDKFNPEYIIVAFDTGKDNFRHTIYSSYKSTRPELPADLKLQFPLAREITQCLNIQSIEIDGVEADDVIASLAIKFANLTDEIIIVSSDKDFCQLVNDNKKICIYDPIKDKYFREKETLAKFGVYPHQVRDLLSLIGDSSDNIPGVPGIGPKAAVALIEQFNSLNNILLNSSNIVPQRRRQLIEDNKHLAQVSWQLIGLKQDLDIDLSIDDLLWSPPTIKQVRKLIDEFGFKSIIARASRLFGLQLDTNVNIEDYANLGNSDRNIIKINDPQTLNKMISSAQHIGTIALLCDSNNHKILFCLSARHIYILDFADISNIGDRLPLSNNLWWRTLIIELLDNQTIRKITYNLKSLLQFSFNILNHNITNKSCIDDIMLMSYTISAGKNINELHKIIEIYNPQISLKPDELEIVISLLEHTFVQLKSLICKDRALSLYYDIDLPICYILHSMETQGIKINTDILYKLSSDITSKIKLLEKEIYDISGLEFNIASPKQLGEVLFDVLKLPHTKISQKTKLYSTDSEVLEKLSSSGIYIAELLLRWRQLTKLLNTYINTLPNQINTNTQRIHTTLLQTTTTTGRLSSQAPNLQNIPIKSDYGLQIRDAFCAEDGNQLLSADYSQIELRILSYLADVKPLQDAFMRGEDAHARTASHIFKVAIEEVTADLRRKAKAINFGIIYGISPFGLAKQLNISNSEAAQYINNYFQEYPAIKEYMERTKEFAVANGYVKNMFGRRCYTELIKSLNYTERNFAYRAAINAPIQGTAADVAKIAMIKCNQLIQSNYPQVKMLLQVHDELVFEIPKSITTTICPLFKRAMEEIPGLGFPLKVEFKLGDSWGNIDRIDIDS